MKSISIPEGHRTYLHLEFIPEIDIEKYQDEEKIALKKYGSWLKALMIGKIEPITDEQTYFLEMCYGKKHPRNRLQHIWKKYQLDVMYEIAKKLDDGLSLASSIFTYDQVVSRFQKLAEQGHIASIKWLERENQKINTCNSYPLIDIARIYPRPPKPLSYPITVLSGSYGSAQR